jgi:hypothetical protein
MHKDATAAQMEDLQQERAFEERFGREMTLEEKKFIALSDEMFRHESLIDPADRRFQGAGHLQMPPAGERDQQERRGKAA